MSTPYYGPDEPEDTINLERFFLAGDFVTGFGYGEPHTPYILRLLTLHIRRSSIRPLGIMRSVPLDEKAKNKIDDLPPLLHHPYPRRGDRLLHRAGTHGRAYVYR